MDVLGGVFFVCIVVLFFVVLLGFFFLSSSDILIMNKQQTKNYCVMKPDFYFITDLNFKQANMLYYKKKKSQIITINEQERNSYIIKL